MKSKIKLFFKYLFFATVFFLSSSIFMTLVYRYVPVYITPLMLIRTITHNYKIEHEWADYKDISKYLPRSVIRAEDANFYEHYGFDFDAIKKAIEYNKKHKKKKGASTISQQTAKNVFLWPSRSYIRKGLEAYFTILIETLWNKERILEVYLNVIELGPGVYGVNSASKKYFKKSAKKVNLDEAALMAAVLPNPIKFKINRPSNYILKRKRKIMGRINIEKPKEDNSDFLEIKFDSDPDDNESNKDASDSAEMTAPPKAFHTDAN